MKSFRILSAITTGMLALNLVFTSSQPAFSATFRYKTAITDTLYTEGRTTIGGVTYDGTFKNSIFDPFAQIFRQFSGFFSVSQGSLGGAVTVRAVQSSPEDRTSLGEQGIALSQYLADAQDVASIPNAVIFPAGLTEFDFKFVPAPIAKSPTVLSKGWSVETVPEPSIVGVLGLLGSYMFVVKKKTRRMRY
jgi:hypothetical protein